MAAVVSRSTVVFFSGRGASSRPFAAVQDEALASDFREPDDRRSFTSLFIHARYLIDV
jgi:hypothetical protein